MCFIFKDKRISKRISLLRYSSSCNISFIGSYFAYEAKRHIGILAFFFFCFLGVRERKYKKEVVDEMAVANLKRCDSICYKITMVLIVCVGFLSAIFRLAISSEVIGYLLMGVLVLTSVIRTLLFCYMDAKGA